MTQQTKKGIQSKTHKALSVIGLALCVVFGFMLICNITIIVKGTLYPERPPSVLGLTPMVVLSGSMSGVAEDHIEVGDLIFVGKADPKELKVGDVIAFMESDHSTTVVTHRIIEIQSTEDGSILWQVKGDANNAPDARLVPEDNLVGIYQFRIPKVGDFAMFLQKPLGMMIFIGIPLLAFIIYDIIRRQHYVNKERSKQSELEAEIARLKTLAGENVENDSTN